MAASEDDIVPSESGRTGDSGSLPIDVKRVVREDYENCETHTTDSLENAVASTTFDVNEKSKNSWGKTPEDCHDFSPTKQIVASGHSTAVKSHKPVLNLDNMNQPCKLQRIFFGILA